MQLFSLPHRLSLVEIHLGTSAAGCRQPPPTRGESAEGQHCSERRNTQYPRERPTPVAARSRRTAAPGASAALGATERREAGSELMGEPAHGVCSSPKRMQLSCGGVKFFAGGQCEHPLRYCGWWSNTGWADNDTALPSAEGFEQDTAAGVGLVWVFFGKYEWYAYLYCWTLDIVLIIAHQSLQKSNQRY